MVRAGQFDGQAVVALANSGIGWDEARALQDAGIVRVVGDDPTCAQLAVSLMVCNGLQP